VRSPGTAGGTLRAAPAPKSKKPAGISRKDLQVNIAAFPSSEQAHGWYNSPEYAKALAFRRVAVHGRLFFVNGTDEPQAVLV
jgi:uncharacterized protein (DUF1330 family)